MSDKFRFALGAAVVLVTSSSLIMDALEMEAEEATREKQDEGDDLILGRMVMGMVEEGTVIGRSEFTNSADSYLVRYRAGDGRQSEDWFTTDALTTREAIEEEFAQQQKAAAQPAEAAPERDSSRGFDEDRPHSGSDAVRGSDFGRDGGGRGDQVLNA